MGKIFNMDCLDMMKNQEFLDYTKGRQCIIVTDPPFNIGYHYNEYKDKKSDDEYYSWLNSIFSWGGQPFVVIHYPEALYRIAFEAKKMPDRVVSWVYNSNTPRQHRDIAFFGVKPDFNQVKQPYKNLNDKRIQQRIAEGKTGCKSYDWFEINQIKNVSSEKTGHPCQMPLEVMKRIVGLLPKDAIIIDPFCGSGTTILAAKILGYDYIGCEIDKNYFDIINKRLDSDITEQIHLF